MSDERLIDDLIKAALNAEAEQDSEEEGAVIRVILQSRRKEVLEHLRSLHSDLAAAKQQIAELEQVIRDWASSVPAPELTVLRSENSGLRQQLVDMREALEDAVLAWRSGEKPSDYPHLLDAAAALVKGDE